MNSFHKTLRRMGAGVAPWFPQVLHQHRHKAQVVHRRQPEVKCIVDLEEMVQVGQRVARAGRAIAKGRHGRSRLDVLVVAGVNIGKPVAAGRKRRGFVLSSGFRVLLPF